MYIIIIIIISVHLAANFSFLTPNAARWRLHSNGKHETLQKNDHRPTNHVLVSLDLWILAKLPHSFSQICQFIGNLPGTHNLSVHANQDSGCGEKFREVCSARRRNYIAIQIGGFLRRFAQRSEETSGRFWLNPGRRHFLARKSSHHHTVNLRGSSILVKDRDNQICDHDYLHHHNYLMVPLLQIFPALRVKEKSFRVPTSKYKEDNWSSTMTEFVSPGSSGNQLQFLHPLFELWADPVVKTAGEDDNAGFSFFWQSPEIDLGQI